MGLSLLWFMVFVMFLAANPWGNLMLFHRWDETRAHVLESTMKGDGIEGMTREEVVTVFGRPNGPEDFQDKDIWHYRASPWFVYSLNHYVQVVFKKDKV